VDRSTKVIKSRKAAISDPKKLILEKARNYSTNGFLPLKKALINFIVGEKLNKT
jgi:hypothetical protein